MAVDINFSSLLQNLKLEDPWLPPKPWESIPSESGLSQSEVSCSNSSSPPQSLYDISTVSEASMVRLVMNALQGVQSALVSIEKLSEAFCSDPADRSFHRISSLWTRSSSTYALGKILNSIGRSGSLVFLLCKFVDYFTNVKLDGTMIGHDQVNSEPSHNHEMGGHHPYSLVNQAFSVAVRQVLEGYMSALDTLYASVGLRRSSKDVDASLHTFPGVGCLTNVVHSEITLLEVYLHTKELRTQIQALGNICNVHSVALCFSVTSFEDIIDKATLEFRNFPRGGDLLTYLYTQLEFADPVHRALLKFLFLRSCEPYFRFVRSWIYEAKISDPYNEFVVEYVDNLGPYSHRKDEISTHFPLSTIRVRDRVAVPCFLRHFLIPLFRAGQQLQVLLKLLELCNFSADDHTYEDILPCWSGFSSYNPTYSSLLTFDKGKIEAMVTDRSNFYTRMQKKLENILTKPDIRYQKIVPHDIAPIFVGSLNNPVSFPSSDGPISPVDKRDSILVIDTLYSEACSSADEFSDVEDSLEAFESSSVNSSEEQNELEQLVENSSLPGFEQKCFSSLSFSSSSICTSNFPHKPPQSEKSNPEKISHEICGRTDSLGQLMHPNHNDGSYPSHLFATLETEEQSYSWITENRNADSHPDMGLSVCGVKNPFNGDGDYKDFPRFHISKHDLKLRTQNMEVLKEGNSCYSKLAANKYFSTEEAPDNSCYSKLAANKYFSTEEAPDNDQLENENPASSNVLALQSWKLGYNSNFFSMNPMLTKPALSHLVKPEEKCSTWHRELVTCFDFSSVENPFKFCVEKLDSSPRPRFGAELPLLTKSGVSATAVVSSCSAKQGCDEDGTSVDKSKLIYASSSDLKHQNAISADICGGSGWESMLAGSGSTINDSVGDYKQSLAAMFEMPLDFIIDKCLLQEIMLQYKYVSKLTIKLLEEGFDLVEHLMALRRFHFMEVADWADLFITYLWHHKWYVEGTDKRISEIQGLLELSVQRSSCERDHNKDRLFVFMKGQGTVPVSASAIGVHSFDFLGLGYRVDWPISIVLTPGALKIYADIFNFLMRVKLAAFALTNVWRSLKDLMHVNGRNHNSELRKRVVHQINFLMKTRHQVNHFVSTLQQYVLSQLSHISWCKFLQSLKDKVKDMIDFESVHMAYLTESLQICFLSDETESVGRIIENILQCALDFQSCLIPPSWGVQQDQDDYASSVSHINMSQVLAIKKTFDQELKELHVCYLKSPKHGEFGLSRFWGYLNHNEYYSNVISNQMGQFMFSA